MTQTAQVSEIFASATMGSVFLPLEATHNTVVGLQITPVMFRMHQRVEPARNTERGIGKEERAKRIRANPMRADGVRAGRQRLAQVVQRMNPDSNLLSSLRLRAGLSQSELADRMDMKQPNVARLEKHPGDPGLSTLRKLAAALSCSLDEVIAAIDCTNQEKYEHA